MTARERVVAFRLARHHLTERLAAARAAEAAVAGLQDTPPGTAAVSLAARADGGQDALDGLVVVPSLRGAPMAVAPEDLAIFTTGLAPPDEAAAKVLVGNAWKALDGVTAMDALDRVSDAVAESLREGPLPKDDFHQALRERLPAGLLWWCRGCGSHHVHPSLWRATGVRGVLAIVGREGRSPLFGTPPPVPPVDDPGAALARRFLQAYGPGTPKILAGWAGIAPSHAVALWARAGALSDAGGGWVLAGDERMLEDAPAPVGVRLLATLDPLFGARDREVLVPDDAVRKRIWRALGGPGVVLAAGAVAGLWRPAKRGRRLVVRVEALRRLTRGERDALAVEAERVAAARGASAAEVTLSPP